MEQNVLYILFYHLFDICFPSTYYDINKFITGSNATLICPVCSLTKCSLSSIGFQCFLMARNFDKFDSSGFFLFFS